MRHRENLEKIRLVASTSTNLDLAVGFLAIVASVTKSRGDIAAALDKARKEGGARSVEVAKALAVIVRVLAEVGRLREAHDVLNEMKGLNTYWHAEAAIALAEFSRDKNDLKAARLAVRRIRNRDLREEARADLGIGNHGVGPLSSNPFFRLVQVAEHLNDGTGSSAYLHAEASAIIDKLFVRKLKKKDRSEGTKS